jgi:hypothetical protein
MGQILLRRPRLHQIVFIFFLSADPVLHLSWHLPIFHVANTHMDACSLSPRTDNNVSEHSPTYSFLQEDKQVGHTEPETKYTINKHDLIQVIALYMCILGPVVLTIH